MTGQGSSPRRISKHHKTPVDSFWMLRLLPFDFGQPISWLLVTAMVYCAGLLVAVLGGWVGPYVVSPAFALGAVGIGWVWTVIAHRVKDAYVLYVDIGAVYECAQDDFDHFVWGEHEEVLSWRRQVRLAGPLAVILAGAAWIAFFRWPMHVLGQDITSLRPWPFHPDVYSGGQIWAKFMVVAGFGVLVGVCIGVTLWLMYREAVCISHMIKLTPVPLPEVVRGRLRPLANFHTRFASEWSIGVALFLILFWQTPDVLSIAFMAVLAILGLAAFIVPQFLLARLVRLSHERACAMAVRAYEELAESSSVKDAEGRVSVINSLRSATAATKYEVYDIGGLVLWLVSQVVAFSCVAIQVALTAKN